MPDVEIVREGVVAVIEREGRFLTITRSQTVIAPGKICFPGGGIEPDESPEDALIRECREELGVRVRPLHPLETSVTPWKVRLRWWAAEIPDENVLFRPDPREVAEIRWMSATEMLAHPDTLESNIPFLERLAAR